MTMAFDEVRADATSVLAMREVTRTYGSGVVIAGLMTRGRPPKAVTSNAS